MGKHSNPYSVVPENSEKSTKARGFNLSVHFKKTLEAANALRGMRLKRAQRYLRNVQKRREVVPYRKMKNGANGRNAQAKNWHTTQSGWPIKSARFLADLLRNAAANAERKGLDLDALQITHIQVNQAPRQRRRTYRAHGRIGPYQQTPCHVELILEEAEGAVARPVVQEKGKKKVSKKRIKRELADAGPVLDMD